MTFTWRCAGKTFRCKGVSSATKKIKGPIDDGNTQVSLDAGFYRLTLKSDTLGLIAFNTDKAESILDQLKPDEVKAALGGGSTHQILEPSSSEKFTSEIKERYLGKFLWKEAILLALLSYLPEVLLIRFLK